MWSAHLRLPCLFSRGLQAWSVLHSHSMAALIVAWCWLRVFVKHCKRYVCAHFSSFPLGLSKHWIDFIITYGTIMFVLWRKGNRTTQISGTVRFNSHPTEAIYMVYCKDRKELPTYPKMQNNQKRGVAGSLFQGGSYGQLINNDPDRKGGYSKDFLLKMF